MKKTFYITLTSVFFGILSTVQAQQLRQKIGANPFKMTNSSAVLEIESTDKGVLLPRVALTATNSAAPLAAHAKGMMVYNTATTTTGSNDVTPGVYTSNGTVWVKNETVSGTDLNDIYSGSGSLQTGTTTVSQGANKLAFSTDNTNSQAFSIDDFTFNVDALNNRIGIGIGTTSPSAVLEVNSTTSGLLVPRMNSNQLNAIASPVNGLVVYDTTLQCMRYYQNNAWTACPVAQVVTNDCANTAFTFDASNGGTFSVKVNNNTWADVTPVFATSDVVLSGVTTGYSVVSVSPTTTTIPAGGSVTVTYTIASTLDAHDGAVTGTWSKVGLTCTDSTERGNGVKPTGSTFGGFFNGIISNVSVDNSLVTYNSGEVFSNNSIAAGKYISAGHTPATCNGSVTGASGTVYPLVLINGQCWFQSNLNEIPSNFNPSPGYNATDSGWSGYYNSATSELAPGEGRLYTWSAAMNGEPGERAQGACPSGFHIPSDAEWMYLEHGLGMSLFYQIRLGNRASTVPTMGRPGDKLISIGQSVYATNASGFSARMGGTIKSDGVFDYRETNGYFWTSSAFNLSLAIYREFRYNFMGNIRSYNNYSKGNAFSVRCLKN